jgi:hypothetical protein
MLDQISDLWSDLMAEQFRNCLLFFLDSGIIIRTAQSAGDLMVFHLSDGRYPAIWSFVLAR